MCLLCMWLGTLLLCELSWSTRKAFKTVHLYTLVIQHRQDTPPIKLRYNHMVSEQIPFSKPYFPLISTKGVQPIQPKDLSFILHIPWTIQISHCFISWAYIPRLMPWTIIYIHRIFLWSILGPIQYFLGSPAHVTYSLDYIL